MEAEAGKGEPDATLRDLVLLLYETSLLVSGFSLPDPGLHVRRVLGLLERGLGLAAAGDDDDADAGSRLVESAQQEAAGEVSASKDERKAEKEALQPPPEDAGLPMEQVD